MCTRCVPGTIAIDLDRWVAGATAQQYGAYSDSTGPTASGDEGNRTLNPRLAKAVLCQLSYVPGSP